MDNRHQSLCLPMIIFLLAIPCSVVAEEVTTVPPIKELLNDGQAEKVNREMFAKLEKVTNSFGYCPTDADTETTRPCIDMGSSQSVLTQMCDRMAALDVKLNKLTSKSSCASNHNSDDEYADMPYTQIAKLKQEIKHLKRSAAFYASRKDKIGNYTHERIDNYKATVNSGVYFDATNGVFMAPFNGIYHFSLSFQKTPEVNLEACLIVDNEVIATTNNQQQPNIDLMTSLKQGQEVWTDLTSNSIPTDSEVSFTFSGFLVH